METENTKRIVEINGIKIEVDLRTAKRVEEFRVGSPVKVLIKKYSNYESFFGMIVGFDEFKSLPTLIVAYLSASTWEDPLKIVYINAKSEDIEICPHDDKDIGLEKADIVHRFNQMMNKKHEEIQELERKKNYFVEMFGRYFPQPSEEQKAN